MQPIIETRRAEVAELCRRFHVRRLNLFGSATGSDFDPSRSNVGLLADIAPNLSNRRRMPWRRQ